MIFLGSAPPARRFLYTQRVFGLAGTVPVQFRFRRPSQRPREAAFLVDGLNPWLRSKKTLVRSVFKCQNSEGKSG